MSRPKQLMNFGLVRGINTFRITFRDHMMRFGGETVQLSSTIVITDESEFVFLYIRIFAPKVQLCS